MFDIERLRVKINNEANNLGFGNLTPHNYKKQIKNYDYAKI
tara:strand:- start:213 stop:335 length:123 start_codon:yes stop_codon:yes gene_type:complete